MFRIKLKELRESHGISQARLAGEIGVSQSTVAMWEAGKNTPEHANLQKIAKLFNVSMGELLDDPHHPPVSGTDVKPSNDDLLFALFGDVAAEITDEDMEDVRLVVELIKRRKQDKKEGR